MPPPDTKFLTSPAFQSWLSRFLQVLEQSDVCLLRAPIAAAKHRQAMILSQMLRALGKWGKLYAHVMEGIVMENA